MYDNTEADIDIQVTGYQWKWRYQYLAEDVDFFSSLSTPREQINNTQEKTTDYLLEVDNPLVIPVGKKVRFLLTANDVIHSWWVPEFAVKKDAIPGFINEAWVIVDKPGVYRGQCAELCGKDHGFMPIVVEVKTVAEYESWLAEVKQAHAMELTREGHIPEALYWLSNGNLTMEKWGHPPRRVQTPCFVGEMSMLTGRPASATVRLTGDGELRAWPRPLLERMQRQQPVLWARVQSVLGLDVVYKIQREEARYGLAEASG